MELILHIGMPKTGSSALQDRLRKSRGQLLEQGILYPETGRTHGFLAFAFSAEGKAPRLKLARMGGDPARMAALHEAGWEKVAQEIAATRPARVILSSEYLFGRLNAEDGPAFRDRLLAAFERVSVIAYVRQPSRDYSATVQQVLKFSGHYPAPAPVPVRASLEAWESLFPGALRVFAYERAQLVNGDITEDFLARALGLEGLSLGRAQSVNTSLSAEAVAILQEFQRRFLPGLDDRRTWHKKRLKEALARADRADPPRGGPGLHPVIAAYMDSASVDLLWLRDRFGLVFAGIDYAAIHEQPPPEGAFEHLSEVFVIDPARQARLEAAVFRPTGRLGLYRLWRGLRPAPGSLKA